MKFTLKDYQDEAVHDLLINLNKAKRRWHEDGDIHAFSLTATTGAGKTVMAAAAFEALFYGDDEFDFDADQGAVVIWFSDDPSLNEQTRFRLLEASDRLRYTDLVVVENTFNRETFQPGKIYFLNTQKLGKNSLLVRGHDAEDELIDGKVPFPQMRPDLRSHTIWDTIQNTIDDPALTLYLVLDEAHRGMGANRNKKDRATIVTRLINGDGSVPPIPIVLGISATVDRFNKAMAGAEGRSTLPNIVVDSAKVQASGLLKDTIILDIPGESGQFGTVLVRRATDKIRESSVAWAEYARQQSETKAVQPLMVLQVHNKPDHNEVGQWLDTILEQWPELPPDSFAHVFGDHKPLDFGRHNVPYISPQRVQESDWVRVLIAKDAISTGWDCPRAEVMVSSRPAKDRTHITQLLGRMVRTPLARRIPGNDRLNAVNCLLPFFDTKSVQTVADTLMQGGAYEGDDQLVGRRVLINPKEMFPNPDISQEVWEVFSSLPSQSLPKKGAKPVKRLTALAHELAADELLADAGKKAKAELHTVLDAAQVRYAEEVKNARQSVLQVEGKSLITDLQGQQKSFDDFLEDADMTVIEDAFNRTARIISPDLARSYSAHLAHKNNEDDSEEALIDALIEARTDIAALGLIPQIKTYLEDEADKLAKQWLDEFRIQIKSLSDERQEVYRQLKSWSTDPQDIELVLPASWMEATTAREADGTEVQLPTYPHHLLSDDNGSFPVDMNAWEMEVLNKEQNRSGFVAWYRNPPRSSQESLGIAYSENKDFKILRPDFIFFVALPNGAFAADIVDPHSYHLSDALPKLQGLAQYAENHGSAYRRIESVVKIGNKLRTLDLTEPSIRDAIFNAHEVKSLYEGPLGNDL